MVDFPLSTHLSMVKDGVRMRTFTRAMRSVITPGCTVVDVGSGTGVLALIAAHHGAGRVLGLERSDLVGYARKVKAHSCPDAPVTFSRKDVLLDTLPRLRADVVVCELLGNFGIEENMIAVLDRVRRHFLKRDGVMVPHAIELMAAPVQCAGAYRQAVGWESQQWGIDFSPLKPLAYNAVYHLTHEPIKLLAEPACLARIDLTTATEIPRARDVGFRFSRAGTIHGFAGWFRAYLSTRNVLDTGPDKPNTHWGQVLFPVGKPIAVERGGAAKFRFREYQSSEALRWSWSGSVRASARERLAQPFSFSASRHPH